MSTKLKCPKLVSGAHAFSVSCSIAARHMEHFKDMQSPRNIQVDSGEIISADPSF